jgi:FAD dependent oxidoreductase TIGR03364
MHTTTHFDLIVIGGGILGTFHAYHAAALGKRVLLMEKDNFPVGATVRNFGQIVPSGMTGKWFGYGVAGLDIYRSIQEQFDISVRRNGSVYIASDPDEQLLIHELKQHYDAIGYEAVLLSQQDIRGQYPAIRSSYAREAIMFPQEISVEPAVMIHRLHQFMRERLPALKIVYNSAAIACDPANGGAMVSAASGTSYEAAKIIICNGYEFRLLYPEIFRNSGQTVSKLQMMRTVPIPEVALPGNILTGLSIRRYESFQACPSFSGIQVPEHYRQLVNWGIHILFKQATDGSFIIGDSHEYAGVEHVDDLGFNINQHVNELMLNEAARIVDFDVRKLAATWAGFYPQHNEKSIFEHDVDENILIRTGIGGKGMTASAGYAKESINRIFG